MEKIALPKKIEVKQDAKSNDGLIIVEPLFPGYGNTVGNALRRVLLSSLSGSAVVGVKIKGVKHEFMALSGVKEDVIDIVLNLKELKLKILSEIEEPIKLELNVQGKKQVTAKDIKKNSQVEISNPDLVLANISDATGNLSMDIYVDKGMGYSLVDKSKEIKEVDYIEVDPIFSPILGVNYNVENIRVGKMTNWDKLVLEVKTDGTVTVEEAFNRSAKILVEQFSALSPKEEVEVKVSKTKKTKKEADKTEEVDDNVDDKKE